MGRCDLDGDTSNQTQLYGGSLTGQIFVNNPGK
jgi:hypothetical protein